MGPCLKRHGNMEIKIVSEKILNKLQWGHALKGMVTLQRQPDTKMRKCFNGAMP